MTVGLGLVGIGEIHHPQHLPHTQRGNVGLLFLCFLTCLRSRLWCNSSELSTGWLATQLCVSPRRPHRGASLLWSSPGCGGEARGLTAAVLTFISPTPRFVLFFSPFEMWLILEAAELVQTVLLRIHPWEFSCKAQEKSDAWEEAKHRFQRNGILMLEQVFLSWWNLSDSLHTPSPPDRWTQRDRETDSCLFRRKHFFPSKAQLSESPHYWLLRNHSHVSSDSLQDCKTS